MDESIKNRSRCQSHMTMLPPDEVFKELFKKVYCMEHQRVKIRE
jgi:hypothetical protein